jgi:hypothetical protein
LEDLAFMHTISVDKLIETIDDYSTGSVLEFRVLPELRRLLGERLPHGRKHTQGCSKVRDCTQKQHE